MNRWGNGLRELVRSTVLLTTGEQKALCLVLALALLGLGVKAWHVHQENQAKVETESRR